MSCTGPSAGRRWFGDNIRKTLVAVLFRCVNRTQINRVKAFVTAPDPLLHRGLRRTQMDVAKALAIIPEAVLLRQLYMTQMDTEKTLGITPELVLHICLCRTQIVVRIIFKKLQSLSYTDVSTGHRWTWQKH